MIKKRIGAGIAAGMMAFVIAGCANTPVAPESSESTTQPQATTAETTTAVTQPEPGNFNPLTGKYDIKEGASTRPVAIMIGNNDKSRPQVNLDKADLFMECETEGGITRIMAVFSGASRVPSSIGPVRSARPPFIEMAQTLGALYVHAGGDGRVTSLIKDKKMNNLNLIHGGSHGAAAWRDASLKKSRGLEYSMMTSGDRITSSAKKLGYSTSGGIRLFTFGSAPAGSGAGKQVQIRFSGTQTINFTYDSMSGLYMKGNGKLSSSKTHKTMAGATISATNVLIMYDESYKFTSTHVGFRLNSGNGVLLTGGTSRNIKWTRTSSSLSFTDESGSALTFNPGKTYICLTSTANKSAAILK